MFLINWLLILQLGSRLSIYWMVTLAFQMPETLLCFTVCLYILQQISFYCLSCITNLNHFQFAMFVTSLCYTFTVLCNVWILSRWLRSSFSTLCFLCFEVKFRSVGCTQHQKLMLWVCKMQFRVWMVAQYKIISAAALNHHSNSGKMCWACPQLPTSTYLSLYHC